MTENEIEQNNSIQKETQGKVEESNFIIRTLLFLIVVASFILIGVFFQASEKLMLLENSYFQSYFEADNKASFDKKINEYLGEKTSNDFYKKREEYFKKLNASVSFENNKILINNIPSNNITSISSVVNKNKFNIGFFQLLGMNQIVHSENLLKFESVCKNNTCYAEITLNN